MLKNNPLPVRLSEPEFDLIVAAANLVGETRSEFLRNAAKEKARLILRDAGLIEGVTRNAKSA